MKPNAPSLSISPAPKKKNLSAGQRKFNSLIKKIEKQRQLIQSWETAIPAYMERWNSDFKPSLDEFHQYHLKLLNVLDDVSERIKLSKTDRQTLQIEICERAVSLMDGENDEAMKALYNKHSQRDFDSEQREEDDLFKQGMEEIFGIDLGDDMDIASPEEIARKLHEKVQAENAKQQTKPGKKTARQQRDEDDAAQASLSVREVYRKLASALHPDRETDAAERERKTALMQRVNHAYSECNLLDLLQLQLELEHIDVHYMGKLAADRLKHYNRILAEQLAELEHEVIDIEEAFKEQFDIDLFEHITPENIASKYQSQVRLLRADTLQLKKQCEALVEPKPLKAWLKEQRDYQKEMEMEDELFDFPDVFFR